MRGLATIGKPLMNNLTRLITKRNDLPGQVVRGGIGSLAIKAAHAALGFMLAVVLARVLGPEGYGIYSFALAIIMFTAIPSQVGIPRLVVRETARTQADADWGLMRGLWRWSNTAVFGASALGMLAVGAILVFVGTSTEHGRTATIGTGIALIPLIALANVRAASLRGLHLVVLGQLPESVFRPTILLLLIAGWITIFGSSNSLTSQTAMGLHILAAGITFLIGSLMLLKAQPEAISRRPILRHESIAWRKAIIPLAMITGLQSINNHADLIILGIFRPNDEVGIYRAVFQIALLVIFGLQAINQVLQPHFARLHRQGAMRKLQDLVSQSAKTILVLALPPVAIFVFFGPEILGWVFGDKFKTGGTPLSILAFGQLINAGIGSVGVLLTMTGHERDALRGVAVAAISNIALNFILIPHFGMTGAATASTLTLIIWNFLLRHSVKKRLALETIALKKPTTT